MAETFRRRKIENFLEKLSVRRMILQNQLQRKEIHSAEQFVEGQLSAVDAIIQELSHEFDVVGLETIEETDDNISESEWLKKALNSSAFSFLSDPEEDIYTLNDGKPIHAEE
mgnify:CR=1 FL=1